MPLSLYYILTQTYTKAYVQHGTNLNSALSYRPEETIYFYSYDWHDEDSQNGSVFKEPYCLNQSTDYVGITRHCRCGRWYISRRVGEKNKIFI